MSDRDRPLSPRGRHAAERMALEIASMGLPPDQILCSPSRRTRETLAAILPALRDKTPVAILDELYDSGPEQYRAAIVSHGGGGETLMVIGHNPAIQAITVSLIGSGKKSAAAQLAAKFPTGALAVVEFEAETWPHIRPETGRLVAFLRPRDLDDGAETEPD